MWTDISEEPIASIIRVTRISELVTTLAVTSNLSTLRRNTILYYTILCYAILYIVYLRSVLRLLVTANFRSSEILVALMMEGLSSYETSVLTRATRGNVPEDAVLQLDNVQDCRSYMYNATMQLLRVRR
jgi:hypothetical protein